MNEPNPKQAARESRRVPAKVPPLQNKELERQVDELLKSKTRGNEDLDVVKASQALDENMRQSKEFSTRRKLILAEVLSLIADAADRSTRERLLPASVADANRALEHAINLGVGLMLRRLRPVEETLHQIRLWRQNGPHPADKPLPDNHTTIVLTPAKVGTATALESPVFHRVVHELLKQSNDKIGRNLYRAFLMLPTNELQGEAASLIPYLRIANRLQVHVLGSIPLTSDKSSLERVRRAWKLRLSSVKPEEQEALSDATLVANQVIVRAPIPEYFESRPIVCGLHYAYAGQMSRYFNQKMVGRWYIPILYPGKKNEALHGEMINYERTKLGAYVESNRINLGYTITPDEEPSSPGVKIYGPATMFPADELDAAERAKHIDLIQSTARVTRNRIAFFLQTQLERFVGGQYSEQDVRNEIADYLRFMKNTNQIKDFHVGVRETGSGHFEVALNIQWSAQAESFEITMNSEEVTAD